MKNLLKNKKTLTITVSALVVLIAAIIAALIIKNKNEEPLDGMTPEEEWSTMMMEGEPSSAGEQEEVMEDFDYSFDEENVMMSNPWFDTDKDELASILDMKFKLPDGATDDTYRMNLMVQLAEVNFNYDGLSYTARIQNSDSYEDISGIYEEWTVVDECDVNGAKGEVMRAVHSDTDMVDVITWFDEAKHRAYSLSTAGNLDGFDIEAVAEQMYP